MSSFLKVIAYFITALFRSSMAKPPTNVKFHGKYILLRPMSCVQRIFENCIVSAITLTSDCTRQINHHHQLKNQMCHFYVLLISSKSDF